MLRKVLGTLAGAVIFFALVGVILQIFAVFGIMPVGQFIQSAFRERNLEESAQFITSAEGFNLMSQGIIFFGFVILPIVSIFTGFLIGWISRTKGWLCSTIAVGPSIIFIMGYGTMQASFSIVICILIAAVSGYFGNEVIMARNKGQKARGKKEESGTA